MTVEKMSGPAVHRYKVSYDHSYMERPGVRPLQSHHVLPEDERALEIVKGYLSRAWTKMARPPLQALRFPYLVPGATYDNLWDWDSFFIACALPDEGAEYAQGSILDLLAGVRPDGRPPKMASPEGTFRYDGHPVPLQAQFVYLMGRRSGGFKWAEEHWETLKAVRAWYERETRARNGYFVWFGFQGNGIDNNPSVYGRPPCSSAGIDLACWHYREYCAMAHLAGVFEPAAATGYAEKAAQLLETIRTRYWDVMDRFFYAIDCMADSGQTSLQGITWELFLKFRNWASFFPLWAGIATKEQAAALRDRAMDSGEFLASSGIRSHSAADPIYNNTPTGNPSNWQGPVWSLSTFVTAYGLARYGYRDEACDLAMRHLRTLAADIETNGCMHEFYHGHTGQPLIKPGFISWNLLALPAMDDLRHGRDCTTLDLLP